MRTEDERFLLVQPDWSRWDVVFLLLLLFAVVLFHWQMVAYGRLSFDEDTLLYFYPLRSISQDPFVGLWDPYLFCGFPRDGNPQSQLLYPPNLVLMILSAPVAYRVLLVGHMATGVVGLYLLIRFMRCSPGPALIGAMAFAGGSFWRCKAMNLGNMEGNSWIPFLLLTFTYGLERGSIGWAVWAGLFGSLIIGAGAPHPVLYAAFLCALFSICVLWSTRPCSRRKLLFFCTVASLVAAGLSAWSWFPAWEYLPRSNRGPLQPQEAYNGSLRLAELPGILLCGLSQKPIARLDPWEGTLFFGSCGLLLAGLGAWRRRNWCVVWALMTAAGIGLIFALGPNTPVYPLLRHLVPGLDYLNLPNRALLLGAWSVPLLIGLDVQEVMDRGTERRRYLSASICCVVILLLVWVHMHQTYPQYWQSILNPALTATFDSRLAPDMEWAVWSALLWGGCACLVLSLRPHGVWGYRPHLAVLAGLILSQEIYVTSRFFFQYTSADFFRPPAAVRLVQERHSTQPGRVLGYAKAIPTAGEVRCAWVVPHLSLRLPDIFRLPDIQGYEPVYPRAYGELIRQWAGQSRAAEPVRHVRLDKIPPRLINFLGVRTIIGDPAARVCPLPEGVIRPGEVKTFDLSETVQTKRLFLRHLCDGMQSVRQGTIIGKVTIRDAGGSVQQFTVRFGREVGEFLPSSPAGVGRAKVFRWWPVPGLVGYRRACNYWSRWRIDPPLSVQTLQFENMSSVGRWVVIEAVLTDVKRDIYPRLFSDGETEVFDNPSAFPPAWIAPSYRVVTDSTERIKRLISDQTDLRRTVILRQEPTIAPPPREQVTDASATVSVDRPCSDEIVCRIEGEATGFLVITEGYSPWWRATAGEISLPVFVADHAFMAVPLQNYSGIVRLVYKPYPFYIGCLISATTLLACLVFAARSWKRYIERFRLRS